MLGIAAAPALVPLFGQEIDVPGNVDSDKSGIRCQKTPVSTIYLLRLRLSSTVALREKVESLAIILPIIYYEMPQERLVFLLQQS